ncbi:hypothetical protein BDU57DRAFT_513056 [Ampelomyces quisqualis]|uniref:Uncharacterized protein n=1 Tax=Ampelomyces quisqualis TaxID=50730 RepID=A0A6A5QY69_AMPQU|nr:hypothetical protein BDU57DRAFT_513056 [Ampelomyces quisqualis]
MSPTVLYPLTLAGLLHHVLATQSAATTTTVIVCSSRHDFLHHLSQSLDQHPSGARNGHGRLQDLANPSLHILLTARRVTLAFCASVQTLLAYLAAYRGNPSPRANAGADKTRLFLVNPLALHASTLSFSAQGLSRSFAAATETALQAGAALHVVECHSKGKALGHHPGSEGLETGREDVAHVATIGEANEDPWEQEVSILNVSARRFGSHNGERAWAGRTVKANRIAARWFRFEKVDNCSTRDGQG